MKNPVLGPENFLKIMEKHENQWIQHLQNTEYTKITRRNTNIEKISTPFTRVPTPLSAPVLSLATRFFPPPDPLNPSGADVKYT